ncbi:DUF5677 domain-containing protein [Rummeliibacillus pycnus]|uniref:DUF5677 domain-containing protein n=1 Tax=Rummeliibacillus pycnus TaxID=101070 RepID=UPI0037C58F4A
MITNFDNLFYQALQKVITEQEKIGNNLTNEEIEKLVLNTVDGDLIKEISTSFFQTLKDNMYEPLEIDRLAHLEFQSRIKQKWLRPLSMLDGFINISEELCTDSIDTSNEIVKLDNNNSEHSLRFFTIMKLLSKLIIISKEISYLLKGGFSDAALSRWRTSHETKIILMLFCKNYNSTNLLNELLKRYNDAAIVEEYKEIISSVDLNKMDPYFINLKIKYRDILDNYGQEFKYSYEWSRPLFKGSNGVITFKMLERYIRDHNETNTFYKKANYQIHSSPLGTFESLGTIESNDIDYPPYIFGPSNFGLRIPGQLIALTLYESIATYLLLNTSLNSVINTNVLELFLNEILNTFDTVEEEIIQEETSMIE